MNVAPCTVDEIEFSGAEDLMATGDWAMFKVKLFFSVPIDQCIGEVLPLVVPIPELLPTRSFRWRKQHSIETLAKMMRHDVSYDSSQRFLRDEVRKHAVQAVKQFYAPKPRHLTFAETFSSMLRSGYESRNPVNPIYWTGLKAQRATLFSHLNDKQQTGPITLGTAIVGPSGIGKSLAVDNTLKLYPQVVQHTSYRGKPFPFLQLTWLKLACPFSGSIKGLTQNFFQSVDRRLGTPLCTPIRRLEDGD